MSDRIRLAEAMGWEPNNYAHEITTMQVNKGYPDNNGPWVDEPGFFPFTDANDDYAVLEWMREQPFWGDDRLEYWMHKPVRGYEIGDYARAALKVIDDD